MQLTPPSPSSGFSPQIAITLEVNGSRYSVGELGPDYVVLDPAQTIEPAHGVLVVEVGGQSVTRRVHLPQGVRTGSHRNPLAVIETAAPTLSAGTA